MSLLGSFDSFDSFEEAEVILVKVKDHVLYVRQLSEQTHRLNIGVA